MNMICDSVIPTKEQLKKIKNDFPVGCHVKLIKMNDEQAPNPGTKGIVSYIDDIGTIFVNWENGSSLGVVFKEDIIERLEEVAD